MSFAPSEWTIDNYRIMLERIYRYRNARLTADQVLYRLMEEVADLVKPVLVYNVTELKKQLADVFAWTCALATKIGINVDEALFRKYFKGRAPGKPVRTLQFYAEAGEGEAAGELERSKRPRNLDEWQNTLAKIYRNENENLPSDVMLMRLLDDTGIAAKFLRNKVPLEPIEDRIAAAMAWTVAIANKYRETIGPLGQVVWERYPGQCRFETPPSSVCECSTFKSIYVSSASDVKLPREKLVHLIKTEFADLTVIESAWPDTAMINQSAFLDISRSDVGVTIVDQKFDPNVFAELTEFLKSMDTRNVFVAARRSDENGRDTLLTDLLKELSSIPKEVNWFFTDEDLLLAFRNWAKGRMTSSRQSLHG